MSPAVFVFLNIKEAAKLDNWLANTNSIKNVLIPGLKITTLVHTAKQMLFEFNHLLFEIFCLVLL